MQDLLIINPKNQCFIDGIDAYPKGTTSQFSNGCLMLCCLPLVISAIVVILLTYHEYQEQQLFVDSRETMGAISSRYTSDNDDGISYYLAFIYTVDGRSYLERQSVAQEIYYEFDVDQPISVTYASNDPSIAYITELPEKKSIIFFIILCMLWVIFVSFFTYAIIHNVQEVKRLKREGQLIYGEMLDISGKRSDEDYLVTIKASFRSPQTYQPITGERRYMANHLANQLPSSTTRIAIYYASDDLWEVL